VPTPLQISPYIKRIGALEGETFTLASKIAPVSSPPFCYQTDDEQAHRIWRIPPGYLFVQGEGLHSVDSRIWGPIPLNNVLGVMLMKLPSKATSSLRQWVITDWLRTGQDAPPFTAQTLSGQVATQQDFLGRRVVFLFLIPEMIPAYTTQVGQLSTAGIPLVVVSVAEPELTHTYAVDLLSTVPILVAPHKSTSFLSNYRISVTPSFCVVNKHGKIEAAGFADQEKGPWKSLVAYWIRSPCETVEKRGR
jgi:hypothetical protein